MFRFDVPQAWAFFFQDPATRIMEELILLHDSIFFYLLIITTIVVWILLVILKTFPNRAISHRTLTHGTTIEIVWTLIPAFILMAIAFPSFKLLYLMDEVLDPAITIKAIGHQWYWSYEYSDYDEGTIAFDSYMVATDDLTAGDYRLLEVDNRIVLPVKTHVRVLVTAADVLHSWAVPSFAVKVDAIPGRLNQVSFLVDREGIFYGQCSELCGSNHGFMPIVLEIVSTPRYLNWLQTQWANN